MRSGRSEDWDRQFSPDYRPGAELCITLSERGRYQEGLWALRDAARDGYEVMTWHSPVGDISPYKKIWLRPVRPEDV